MSTISPMYKISQRVIITLLVVVSVFAGTLLVQQVTRGLVLETDLQALFPRDEDSHLINRAGDRLAEEFGNQLLLAVSADERDQALRAANVLETAIVASGFMVLQKDEQWQAVADQQSLLQNHRFHLLTDSQRQWLHNSGPSEILRRAQTNLFGFSTDALLSPALDPMALFADYARGLQPYLPGEIVDDRLLIHTDGKHLVVISAVLQGDAFNLAIHKQMNQWLEHLQVMLVDHENVTLLMSGAVFHAAEASTSAQREVTIISAGSVLGILLLFLLTFRRVKPLLLSFASVLYGCAVALAVNHWLFGKLHLMTLVFGASLIGVAIDYALHYLCKHQQLSLTNQAGGGAVLDKLLPILGLSLLTSLLGYGCLLQAELPGLRQIAGFSLIGLAAAWLFAVGVFPFVVRGPLPPPWRVVQTIAAWPWQLLPRLPLRALVCVAFVVVVGSVLAFSQGRLGSDLRLLYQPSPALLHAEKTLHQSLQGFAPNQYFLLQAATPEALLVKEEAFRTRQLDTLVTQGALRDYTAVSRILPSSARQQDNYRLLDTHLYGEGGLAFSFMRSAGFGEAAVVQLQAGFTTAKGNELQLADWLAVARPDQRLLWLGDVEGTYASIIALRGIQDVPALATAAQAMDGVIWVDRVAEMSRVLKELQASAMNLLALAYLVVAALMWLCYRQRRAMLLVLVPLSATVVTLALLSVWGISINLFHVFGCFLILGLGMDYSIFAYQSGAADESHHRAILLSALTSGLSFGLLAISSTPMVSAFGLVLLLGSLFNLLLAPLLGRLRGAS